MEDLGDKDGRGLYLESGSLFLRNRKHAILCDFGGLGDGHLERDELVDGMNDG